MTECLVIKMIAFRNLCASLYFSISKHGSVKFLYSALFVLKATKIIKHKTP